MSYGTALVLIAVGAVMRFAVTADAEGFSINTAGTILMVIGVVGLVLSLLWTAVDARRRATVPAADEAVRREPRHGRL